MRVSGIDDGQSFSPHSFNHSFLSFNQYLLRGFGVQLNRMRIPVLIFTSFIRLDWCTFSGVLSSVLLGHPVALDAIQPLLAFPCRQPGSVAAVTRPAQPAVSARVAAQSSHIPSCRPSQPDLTLGRGGKASGASSSRLR